MCKATPQNDSSSFVNKVFKVNNHNNNEETFMY